MRVEILYVEDCPNAGRARELVGRALAERGLTADVEYRLVSPTPAGGNRFAGSPTILINGRDIEPAAATGIACRIYANGSGCPSLEAVRDALAHAAQETEWNAPQ